MGLARTFGLAAALVFGVACSEPGPGEKAGKAIDDAVDKIQHGDEGTLEKAGRKMGESLEELGEDLEEATEAE
jgi:hypothetical protein